MKNTGMVRRIDELGRIVIPKEIRRQLMLKEGESVSFFVDQDEIILKKFSLLQGLSHVIDCLLDGLENKYHNIFLVTDLKEILMCSSSGLSQYQRKKLSNDLSWMISQNRIIKEEMIDYLDAKHTLTLFPLLYENKVIGSLMMLTQSTPYYMIDEDLLMFTKDIIEQEINACV